MRAHSVTANTASKSGSAPPGMPIDVRLMRTGANVLLVLVLLAGLAVLVDSAARSPWFNLRQIHVEGRWPTTARSRSVGMCRRCSRAAT